MSDESRETTRRLTIEEVKAALDKTGFTLARRVTLSRARKCGCPIGVVAWSDGKLKTFSGVGDVWGSAEAIGLIPPYATGLIEGFDGSYPPHRGQSARIPTRPRRRPGHRRRAPAHGIGGGPMNGPQSAWHGVTVHDQATADARIPGLLATPAAVRFVVAELSGPVDLTPWLEPAWVADADPDGPGLEVPGLDWAIVSGGDQPVHPDWVRSIRDACVAAGVPFCFRGWGEWAPGHLTAKLHAFLREDGSFVPGDEFFKPQDRPFEVMSRVGKANSGRMLDGRIWDEWPQLHGSEAPDE